MSIASENPQGPIDTKIRISNGKLIDLADFKAEDVCVFSIGRSLNNIKRFTGHWKDNPPLTVAQHTKLCERIAELLFPLSWSSDRPMQKLRSRVIIGCRIHDWPEAYYGDLSTPLKRFLGEGYRNKIKEIDKTVYECGWLSYDLEGSFEDVKEEVKKCDHLSLRIEQLCLFGTVPPEDWVKEFMVEHDTREMYRNALALQDIQF